MRVKLLSVAILSIWLSGALCLNSASAIPTKQKFKLPPPPQRGIVGNRSAAASRDRCLAVPQPLTAIVPAYITDPAQPERFDGVWGLTAMERPTFWFYLPYPKTEIVEISFTLQDESNPNDPQIVYQNLAVTPSLTSNLMSVRLPQSIAPLALNKPYRWFLKVNRNCGMSYVRGWVQRQDLTSNLRDRLPRIPLQDRATLYAENGLFYDAVAILASLKISKPQDPSIQQDWQNLLDSIELQNLEDRSLKSRSRSVPEVIETK
jgi:Domain of Unknown Function (DUF928)